MHGPINVKSPNITNWQMRFNSAFKGLIINMIRDKDIIGDEPFQRVEIEFIALLSAHYIVGGQFSGPGRFTSGENTPVPIV
jgi:hypothetical protein